MQSLGLSSPFPQTHNANMILDAIFTVLLPTLILLHLFLAPYTKVEESFNIQATHDILTHGLPLNPLNTTLLNAYDHISFPGAVPRTFIGALLLAAVSKPILLLTSPGKAQYIVRAVLGLWNARCLFSFRDTLVAAFGEGNLKYTVGAALLVVSSLGSLAASTGMLLISSLNYPGGQALSTLHEILARTPQPSELNIHMDVLSCMTGVTHFLELPSPTLLNNHPTKIHYDKTENSTTLVTPSFWYQFDYAIMQDPALAIGKWEVIDTIYAYAGIEFLRPGDGTSFTEHLERIYAANNLTVLHQGKREAPTSDDVKSAVEDAYVELGKEEGHMTDNEMEERRLRIRAEEMNQFGAFNLVRDGVRGVTRGWWVGPRMVPSLRILRQVRG
ncbi:putative Dol-P-Man:Man(7)GlcNAc(2)-PP-Dol alpha-1,6-mannosyltransferase [Glarea lozoyensis 74030]|uniref:Mannosyltransferase n=1 Tax=Glarea lozoyensis (strain ATCC 74030 / MF5533) TaxID=1104152 RepID=H0ECU1_GLAL7|nr:putative Dol-P-Man:Man(7)GlcNAc(2)-PP-Dol alpha-1,6-mannosyltransferase [Glarea lozoyensis 74030]